MGGLSFGPVEVEFSVLNEPWNEYRLRDKSKLRTKFVLTRLFRMGKDRSGNPLFNIGGQNLAVVSAPPDLKGPSESRVFSPSEISSSVVDDDVSYDTKSEGWSVYELDDGSQLHIKLVLAKVSRTSLHDLNGDPIYAINTQPVVKPLPSRKVNG